MPYFEQKQPYTIIKAPNEKTALQYIKSNTKQELIERKPNEIIRLIQKLNMNMTLNEIRHWLNTQFEGIIIHTRNKKIHINETNKAPYVLLLYNEINPEESFVLCRAKNAALAVNGTGGYLQLHPLKKSLFKRKSTTNEQPFFDGIPIRTITHNNYHTLDTIWSLDDATTYLKTIEWYQEKHPYLKTETLTLYVESLNQIKLYQALYQNIDKASTPLIQTKPM